MTHGTTELFYNVILHSPSRAAAGRVKKNEEHSPGTVESEIREFDSLRGESIPNFLLINKRIHFLLAS